MVVLELVALAVVRCGRGLQGQLISQYHLPLSPGQIINLPITSHRPADDAQITRRGQLNARGRRDALRVRARDGSGEYRG